MSADTSADRPAGPSAGSSAEPRSDLPRPFVLGRLPRVTFGPGRLAALPAIAAAHGRRALVVTGSPRFAAGPGLHALVSDLEGAGVAVMGQVRSAGEPSPDEVDAAVAGHRDRGIEVVVAIGGGSALDLGKAVAGLLRTGTSAMDHLEVVGRGLPYPGPAVPLVAVPTTAGTGTEATRNAVLSRRGPDGFKRSLRDERLVPADAIVDPDLLAGAPRSLIAANGMDALTQLLEPLMSSNATPVTDALALSGLAALRDGLLAWHADPDGPGAPAARQRMAYAALLSGICLANAGLGAVHGFASPLGGLLPIPHGAACGAVLAAATRTNVSALRQREPGSPALIRAAEAGRILGLLPAVTPDAGAADALVAILEDWTRQLGVAGLASFGMTEAMVGPVARDARAGSMKTNPIELTDDELRAILRASL